MKRRNEEKKIPLRNLSNVWDLKTLIRSKMPEMKCYFIAESFGKRNEPATFFFSHIKTWSDWLATLALFCCCLSQLSRQLIWFHSAFWCVYSVSHEDHRLSKIICFENFFFLFSFQLRHFRWWKHECDSLSEFNCTALECVETTKTKTSEWKYLVTQHGKVSYVILFSIKIEMWTRKKNSSQALKVRSDFFFLDSINSATFEFRTFFFILYFARPQSSHVFPARVYKLNMTQSFQFSRWNVSFLVRKLFIHFLTDEMIVEKY